MTTKRMTIEEAAAGFFDELLCRDDFDGTWFLVSRAEGLEQIEEFIQFQRDSAVDECIAQIYVTFPGTGGLPDWMVDTLHEVISALQALKTQKEDKTYG